MLQKDDEVRIRSIQLRTILGPDPGRWFRATVFIDPLPPHHWWRSEFQAGLSSLDRAVEWLGLAHLTLDCQLADLVGLEAAIDSANRMWSEYGDRVRTYEQDVRAQLDRSEGDSAGIVEVVELGGDGDGSAVAPGSGTKADSAA